MAKVFWTLKEKAALREKTYEVFNRPVFFQSLFDAFAIAQRDVLTEDRKRTVTPQQIVWVLEGEPLEGNSSDYAKSYLSVLCAKLKTNKPTLVSKKRRTVKEVSEGEILKVVPVEPSIEVDIQEQLDVKPEFELTEAEVIEEAHQLLAESSEIQVVTAVAEAVDRVLENSDINFQLMLLVESVNENTKSVKYLADRLDTFITLHSQHQQQQKELQKELQKEQPETTKRKPMVLVLNLLPVQFAELEKMFSNYMDLRSWEGSKGNHQTLKSLVQNAYRIYAHTDHMRHCDDTKVSKLAGSRYVRFSGSTTTIKGLLADLMQAYWSKE